MKRILVTLALGLTGCALFDGDAPSRSCRTDSECFRAQGERCNQTSKTCEVAADAGIDGAVPVDGAEPDAAVDAALDVDAPVDADIDAMLLQAEEASR